MVPLSQLDAKSIMSRDVLEEVFSQEDEVYRAEMLADLALRASELRCKAEFKQVVAAYKRAEREIKKQEAEEKRQYEQLNLFTDYEQLKKDEEEEVERLNKEKNMQHAVIDIKKKFGKNAILNSFGQRHILPCIVCARQQ